jgi:hypothetical protein
VGLSAIAFLGVAEVAQAGSVWRGSDYLATPGGETTVFDFGGAIGGISFKGVPFGPGNTDTIVERQKDCLLTVGGSCTIPIEMTALSLMSEAPVNIGGFNYNVFAGLDSYNQSIGEMTINHQNLDTDPTQGTFSSILDVFFLTSFEPIDGGVDIDDITEMVTMTVDNAPWSHNPGPSLIVRGMPGDVIGDDTADQKANCHSQGVGCPTSLDSQGNVVGDFFPGIVGGKSTLIQHDASGANKHGVTTAVPEPLTILGSFTAMGFGTFFKRKLGKKLQQEKA